MKKILYILFATIFICPLFVRAEEIESEEVLSETKKYYKTVVVQDDSSVISLGNDGGEILSYTEEISKEEFDAVDPNESNIETLSSTMTIETTYKEMTTTITKNGSYYRYKVTLDWKLLPKIRSYDVIAIGHYKSVELASSIYFQQEYCTSLYNCTTSTSATRKETSSGSGAVFKLPTGTYLTLSQKLYFDVKKATDATVIKQVAIGDYSHAIKNISSSISKTFSVNVDGIYFSNTNTSYFDSINPAISVWTGSW